MGGVDYTFDWSMQEHQSYYFHLGGGAGPSISAVEDEPAYGYAIVLPAINFGHQLKINSSFDFLITVGLEDLYTNEKFKATSETQQGNSLIGTLSLGLIY
jgi:hypothetical protein